MRGLDTKEREDHLAAWRVVSWMGDWNDRHSGEVVTEEKSRGRPRLGKTNINS
jgi:hypothetical protein